MRFSLVALFAVAVPAALASAIPSYADAQNAVSTARDQVEQLTFGTLDNPDDACPDLIVRCVRKDKGGELVGEVSRTMLIDRRQREDPLFGGIRSSRVAISLWSAKSPRR